MARSESKPHTILVLTLAAMLALTVTPAALANHNSLGGEVHIIQADEYNRLNGTLERDIPVDSPLRQAYHDQLNAFHLPARTDPIDQTGESYTDCTPRSEFGTQAEYENALPNYNDEDIPVTRGDACYVGLLDHQLEYWTLPSLFLASQPDDLYFLNPEADDDYCNGRTEQEDPGTVPDPLSGNNNTSETQVVDDGTTPHEFNQSWTRALHSTDQQCMDNSHRMLIPAIWGVDTDILEPEAAADAADTNPGSGTYTLPVLSSPYIFAFGQPHPATNNETDQVAGQGIFGPDPIEMGGPFRDLTGACGLPANENPDGEDTRRTGECKMLDPESIRLYDDDLPSGVSDDVARMCIYTPQVPFSSPDPGVRLRGQCGGMTGRNSVVETFIPSAAEGGLDSEAVPPTYVHTLPGWYWGVIYTGLRQSDHFFDFSNEPDGEFNGFIDDYLDDEKEYQDGFITYVAINPRVPQTDSQIACMAPGLQASGSTITFDPGTNETGANVTNITVVTSTGETFHNVTLDGHLVNQTTTLDDPGFYGSYQADAIDADVFPLQGDGQLTTIRDLTHDDARALLRNTDNIVAGAAEIVNNNTPSTIPGASTVNALLNETANATGDLLDRADYFEGGDPEPHAQPGDQNQDRWTRTIPKGLLCNALNRITFRPQNTTLEGGLRFDLDVSRATVSLKDPTLSNGTLPAQESDTTEGTWQTDVYSFGAAMQAVLDANNNGQFDACASEGGRDADEDACPWRPLWDAYNTGCSNVQGEECGTLLESRGYNTSGTGVGLYFVLRTTGPTLLMTDELGTTEVSQYSDRSRIMGETEPLATHCVIGASKGYMPHLKRFLENTTSLEDPTNDDVKDEFCGDADGERHIFEDAFNDQSAATGGTASAGVMWAKLLPTPKAAQDLSLGDGDQLCLSGVWTVDEPVEDDNETAKLEDGFADDTKGNLNLGNSTTGHELVHYEDCDPLTTRHDENPDEAGEGEPKAD